MRDFICPKCGQHLAFENSVCLNCGSALGYSLERMALLVIAPEKESEHGGAVDANQYQLCANLHLAQCNWLVERGPVAPLCASCALTRTRPNDTDTKALAAFASAEKAKRRLIAELVELKLPIVGRDGAERRLDRVRRPARCSSRGPCASRYLPDPAPPRLSAFFRTQHLPSGSPGNLPRRAGTPEARDPSRIAATVPRPENPPRRTAALPARRNVACQRGRRFAGIPFAP